MSETAVHDPRPEPLELGVVRVCQASIVIAVSLSVELNIYQHLEGGQLTPWIGVPIGIGVPILVAFLSHAAARVNFHRAVQVWVFVLAAVLMYVSASAGIKVLTPALGFGPALATSVGMDLTALTTLGFLMFAAAKDAALKAWQGREDTRLRQARTAELDREFRRPGRAGNGGGTGQGNGQGNDTGPSEGNGEGNDTGPSPDQQHDSGNGGGGTVTPIRRVVTDEQMRVLARALADDLAARGERLTVAAYRAKYPGKNKRIADAVRDVNAERAGAGQQPAATGVR